MFHLDQFISQYVTKRPVSMFSADIEANRDALSKKIAGKSVLVIGGAGSIGSSFIKALLPFKPASLVVVDYNENALAELTRDLRSTKGMYVPGGLHPYPMVSRHRSLRRCSVTGAASTSWEISPPISTSAPRRTFTA